MTSTARWSGSIEELERALSDKGLIRAGRLRQDLGNLGIDRPVADEFIEEVLYALYPPIHEQRTPLYGAMTRVSFWDDRRGAYYLQPPLPLPLPRTFPTIWEMTDLGVMRMACDGQRSFLLRDSDLSNRVIGVAFRPDELSLSEVQTELGITTIQRTGDGKVRLYLPRFLAIFEKNDWSLKPYSDVMAWPLQGVPTGPELQQCLDLAVHVLSSSNVGATFVLASTKESMHSPALDFSLSKTLEGISVMKRSSFPLLRNLAAQHDRAFVVAPGGAVHAFGVRLLDAGVPESVTTDGGTRHNSAIRASFAEHDCIFVVSSADGPVSIFYQGHKVASFDTAEFVGPCRRCRGRGELRRRRKQGQDPKAEQAEQAAPAPCTDCGGSGRSWSSGPIFRPFGKAGLPDGRAVRLVGFE